MARTIYENIGVEFVLEEIDEYEAKIKVNDKTLIYISREQEAEFEEELKKLFDKYRNLTRINLNLMPEIWQT